MRFGYITLSLQSCQINYKPSNKQIAMQFFAFCLIFTQISKRSSGPPYKISQRTAMLGWADLGPSHKRRLYGVFTKRLPNLHGSLADINRSNNILQQMATKYITCFKKI